MEMKNCALCYNETEFSAVSSCGHSICLLCSARLRILCKQKDCPQCRESQEEVIITRNLKPSSSLRGFESIRDKHGFVFSDESSRAALSEILAFVCPLCKVQLPSMRSLQDHVRRTHDRQYCNLCVKELKLFPFEHKVYTRQLLIEHRRDGDRDDKSHKGHPLCKFCDERYLDNDALFLHLKEKHFWCHFCEADGKQEYYDSYPFLRKHYRKSHFLCEEGQCRYEKYTAVFRSSLDFQAHKAKVHSRGLSKAEVKQLRQVEVGFSYARETPAPSYQQSRGRMASQACRHQREAQDIERAKLLSLSESTSTINNSSSKENRGRSRAGQKSPPRINTNSSDGSIAPPNPGPDSCPTPHTTAMSILPPVDNGKAPSHEEKRSVQVKPPPGLGGVVVVEPSEQDSWPLLDSVPAKKGSPGPPPGFHGITPKPSHYSLSDPMHSSWSAFSQAISAPPGLAVAGEFGMMPNSASVDVCDRNRILASPFLSDSDVIEVAEAILNNNPDKVSRFRSLSGKYQSGAVSVDEYHSECERLFGSTWKELGPRLAATIPDKRKQDRLLKKLGRAFVVEEPLPWKSGRNSAAAVNKYMMEDKTQAAWLYGGRRNYLTALSEEEYPSLGSKVGIPTHSATPTWSCKVSVK